ncbi:MAG TPA: hypothetical protein VHJ17_02490 [Thermomonospora sp.]|nr:hypothetical protein [Thermomonospora sp.]
MRVPFRGGGAPVPVDVPLGVIADAVETVRTARMLRVLRYASGSLHEQGLWDFERHLGIMRTMTPDGPVDRLYTRTEVFRLLSPEEQDETGRVWRREPYREEIPDPGRAGTVAALRRLAEPAGAAVETVHGERLHRFTLRVRTRPGTGDPLLDALHRRAHAARARRMAVEAWLTGDGALRQVREHAVLGNRPRGRAEFDRYCWDFGVDVGALAPPAPAQILDEEAGRGARGLTVLIDGEVSPY